MTLHATRFNSFLFSRKEFDLIAEYEADDHRYPYPHRFYYIGYPDLVGCEWPKGSRMVCPIGDNWFISRPEIKRLVPEYHERAKHSGPKLKKRGTKGTPKGKLKKRHTTATQPPQQGMQHGALPKRKPTLRKRPSNKK